jgi:RNA methyltransferase, TrmH family
MRQILEISSLQNPKIKKALALFDRRDRDETSLFLIEGYRELKRAVDKGVTIQSLFFCKDLFLGENEPFLIQQVQLQGGDLFSCSEPVFRKISYRDRPDGLIAIAVQMRQSFPVFVSQLQDKKDPFLLIAESIEKPGNLGTILRSCDAVGVDGVIVCDRCTDIYNPNVVRASVGTLFTQPVIESNGADTIVWLQKNKVRVIASSPHADVEFTDADLTGPVAIVVGTEQIGLSEKWLQTADLKVRIPMRGVADSLNVATATTLLLYEVLRQRKQKGIASWM